MHFLDLSERRYQEQRAKFLARRYQEQRAKFLARHRKPGAALLLGFHLGVAFTVLVFIACALFTR